MWDILSSKLVFQQKEGTEIKSDSHLDIQYFRGTLKGNTGEEQLQGIISCLNDKLDWLRQQPVEALIGIIGEVAKKWLSDERFFLFEGQRLAVLVELV